MRTTVLIIAFWFAQLIYSLPLKNTNGKGAVSDDFQCEPEENECSKCFDVLANELFIIDRNRYNLQRAFFPPDIANPVFVSVTYYFTRNMSGDGFTNYSLSTPSMNWFWTQSTFYLFQPLESLQFSSLFFSDPSLRETTLSLYLQPNCSEVSLDMMKLLTQRLKLFAMEHKVNARISDAYSAKGENLITLQRLQQGKNGNVLLGNVVTEYTLSFYIIFPMVVIFLLAILFYHLIENNQKQFFWHFRTTYEKEENVENEAPNKKLNGLESMSVSTRNMYILISVVGSLSFVVYVFVLDCFALYYRLNVKKEIFFIPGSKKYNEESKFKFEIEFSIPIIMFVYDLIIMLLIIFIPLVKLCCGCLNKWYYFSLGPFSCIIVHSYHILVGFIHNPHHASAVMIFYAIIVVVFVVTYRTTYYNLVHCYKRCSKKKKQDKKEKKPVTTRIPFDSQPSTNGKDRSSGARASRSAIIEKEERPKEKCEVPNELTPFIKTSDEEGIKSLDTSTLRPTEEQSTTDSEDDKKIKDKKCKCCGFPICIFLTFLLLSLLLTIIMVYVMVLFILIPINSAIDDAPERLFSINQTVIILIGASVTYNLYKTRTNNSILAKLVNANVNRLKDQNNSTDQGQETVNNLKKWQAIGKVDQEKEIAGLLIDALLKMKNRE